MVGSKNNKLGFVAVFISMIFLFNANINIIDLLPDFCAYIILCFALTKLSDMSEEIATAKKMFWYMIFIDLSKYLTLLWVFGIAQNEEQGNAILLATFIYSVIEIIALSIAFGKLFDGLTALGYSHPNTSILGRKNESGGSYTDKIKTFTIFFIVAKTTIAVLPELSVLPTSEYNYSSFAMYLYESIGVMRTLAVFFSTIIGVIWLVKILRYYRRILNDNELMESLCDRYDREIAPKASIHVRRNVRRGFMCFIAAAVFMFDLRVEDFNLTPDILSAILFIAGFIILRKQIKSVIYVFATSAAFLICTIVSQICEIYFFENYYYGAVYRSPEVYRAYVVKCIVGVLPYVAFSFVIVSLVLLLKNIIIAHTGYIGTDDASAERLKTFHSASKKRLWLIIVAATILVATELFYLFGAIRFGFAGLLGHIGALVFLLASLKTFSEITDNIETKYVLD